VGHLKEQTFIVSDKRSLADMQEALAALLGKDAPNLSPAVLARLKTGWQEEFERWKRRDLSARRYVYI
jgi:putative transposase